jgi:hypothetical protein
MAEVEPRHYCFSLFLVSTPDVSSQAPNPILGPWQVGLEHFVAQTTETHQLALSLAAAARASRYWPPSGPQQLQQSSLRLLSREVSSCSFATSVLILALVARFGWEQPLVAAMALDLHLTLQIRTCPLH